MKVEPRAWLHDGSKEHVIDVVTERIKMIWLGAAPKHVEHYTIPLYTVADVLAALRQPSVAMIHAANPNDDLDVTWKKMLDAFEREQQPWRTLPR